MKKLILALAGLLAFAAGAHAQGINAQTGTTYTALNTDCGNIVTLTNASAIAVTLPRASGPTGSGAAAGTFMPPCSIQFVNLGAGLATITPTTSTIQQGVATLTLASGEAATVTSDGTNYQSQRSGEVSMATYFFTGTPAATNQTFFVAPHAMRIVGINQIHTVAAGGTSTLTVEKITGVVAPGSGTTTMTGSFNLNATANTFQTATLTATAANALLAVGDRLGVVFANAIQSSAGVTVSVMMIPQ